MREWRREWRNRGLALIASATLIFVARLGVPDGVVVYHRRIVSVGPAYSWLVNGFAAGIAALGCWILLAIESPRIPWLGKRGAQDPDCRLTMTRPETIDVAQPEHGVIRKCILFYIEVENIGETATFAAQISHFENVMRSDGLPMDEYVTGLGWEEVADQRQVIGTTFRRHLGPFRLWPGMKGDFNIPHTAAWSGSGDGDRRPMRGWQFIIKERGQPVGFRITIANESKVAVADWRVTWDWRDFKTVENLAIKPLQVAASRNTLRLSS